MKDKNIVLKGADLLTAQGFTQVPNFLLKSKKLNVEDKMTFAMLLSYPPRRARPVPGGTDDRHPRDPGINAVTMNSSSE